MLDDALAGARTSGVEQVVTVGLNVEDSDANREIAEEHPGVFFSVGWHPHEKTEPDAAQLAALRQLLDHPRAVAVGEVGIDQYWRPGYHEVPLETQQRSLRLMLELAEDARKPVIIHDRDSHDEVLAALERWPGVNGVMHCFSGDAEFGRRCRKRGFLLSFSGIVTFPRSEGIQAAAREVDAGGYLVETDAPFLAPVPHRGRDNRPAYVAATANRVAEIRGVDATTVRVETANNARRLFRLPADDVLGR